jgi:hypothetical protein
MADATTLTKFLIAYGNPWRMMAWPLDDKCLDYYDVRQVAHKAFKLCPALKTP